MNIDQQIQQALNEETKEFQQNNERINANPFKQMKAGFKGSMKWIYIQVIFYSALFFIGMIYCAYRFYHEQEPKALLAWAVGIIILALFTQISKLWYWTELGHNRVIREMKLLELQIAQMAEKQEK